MPHIEPTTSTPTPADPFQHLHKMSTTAGAASAEYVAINGLAVIAALLGVVALLPALLTAITETMTGELPIGDILLIVPIAGLICGVTALRQIARSNRTQTGRLFAWAGLLLSLGSSLLVLGSHVVHKFRTHGDQRAIVAIVQQFEVDIKADRLDNAYKLFGAGFGRRVDLATFKVRFDQMYRHPAYGRIQSLKWNGQLHFVDSPDTHLRHAASMIIVQLANNPELQRFHILFTCYDGQWRIDKLPFMFPEPEQP